MFAVLLKYVEKFERRASIEISSQFQNVTAGADANFEISCHRLRRAREKSWDLLPACGQTPIGVYLDTPSFTIDLTCP